MNKKVITNHQLFTFTALSTLGGSILVISSTIAGVAKQDAWLSVLLTTAAGTVMMWIYCYLGTRYEGLTLIGICNKLFGKWLGKIISAGYLLMFFSTAYRVPWYIGSFGLRTMHEMPILFILIPFIVALIAAVYYDIESFARASEIFYIFVTVLFVISIVLVLPNIKMLYISPSFEDGFIPIIKGAILLSGFVATQNITLLMIYPVHISDKKEGKKAFFKGFFWANAVVFVTTLVSILVLGTMIVAKSSFPTLLLAREINVGSIVTRLEYVISMLWTVSEFGIGILYFYVTITGLSEYIGLKNHKRIILPMGLLVMLMALIINNNAAEQANYVIVGYTPNTLMFGFIIPVVMLVIYKIRSRFFEG